MNRGLQLLSGTRKGRVAARGAAAVLLLGMISVGSGASAAAANTDPRLWYFNDFGVQDAFDAGYSGQGVTIAVIDSRINPSIPALEGANLSIHEPAFCDPDNSTLSRLSATTNDPDAFHGTNMAALILGNGTPPPEGVVGQLGVAPGARVNYYASAIDVLNSGALECSQDGSYVNGDNTAGAIDLAVADGAQIISMSFTENSPKIVSDAVARALRAGVVLLAGTSNDPSLVSGMAAMNGVVTIQAMDSSGVIQESSRKSDPGIDIVGPGVDVLGVSENWSNTTTLFGTSNATAITAGFLALVKSKYPSATGNQLVQTLVRNTFAEDHPFEKDPDGFFGYGIVSLRHMMAVDPSQYPDTNPLIENPGDSPSYEEIFGHSTTPSAAEPSTLPSADGVSGALGLLPVILLIVLVVVVVAGAVTTVLVARSRKQISR